MQCADALARLRWQQARVVTMVQVATVVTVVTMGGALAAELGQGQTARVVQACWYSTRTRSRTGSWLATGAVSLWAFMGPFTR